MTKFAVSTIALIALFLSVAPGASAQDVEAELIPEIKDTLVQYDRTGWHPRLKLNGNFALGHSKNVPGNTDGASVQFGALLNGTADYLSTNENHEWTNALLWDLGYTQTPAVKSVWIKSMDRLEFKTAYLYHLPRVKWLGPFFAFRLNTTVLPSYEVHGESVHVVRLEPGEAVTVNDAGTPVDENGNPYPFTSHSGKAKIDLTDSFAPLTLRQTLGLFAKPLTRPELTFDTRLGIGAWETFSRNGYVIEENDNTDFLLLRRLQDPVQVGAELGAVLSGILKDGLLSYSISALFMQPFAYSDNIETDLEGIELLNREFEASLGVNLTKYFSINYSFKAVKQPLIVDAWQIQNNLLISVGFDLVGNPPPPAPEPPCDCADAVNSAKAKWEAEAAATTATEDAADAAAPAPEAADTTDANLTPTSPDTAETAPSNDRDASAAGDVE